MPSLLPGSQSSSLKKTGPRFKGSATSRGEGTVSITVPTVAQPGDYLVFISSNGGAKIPSDWGVRSGTGVGGTFFEVIEVGLKICGPDDPGRVIQTNAGNFFHANLIMVFSNPNNTLLDLGGGPFIFPTISYTNWLFDTAAFSGTVNPASQINIPMLPTGYGPGYVKIVAAAANPDSNFGNANISGSYNQKFFINDGFWFRSLVIGYQENATYENPISATASFGSIVGVSLYLI